MKKILITGVSGFLGWNLFRSLKKRYPVAGTFFHHHPPREKGDITRLDLREGEAVEKIISEYSPGTIIHTAAITSPAECRKNPGRARSINVQGTINIARAAVLAGSRLIYISTDRVFSGRRGDYKEEDSPAPLGTYGETKLEGEERIKQIAAPYLILRLPLMYGLPSPFHGSFINWMIDAFRSRQPLFLFTDQFRTPLYVGDAVQGIKLLLRRAELEGVYHLGGPEKISRAAFGFKLAEIFGFDPAAIRSIPMADKPHLPPSPADVSLNSDKFFRDTGFRARSVEEGLLSLKEDLNLKR